MKLLTYIRQALTPGGTKRRYFLWVSIIMLVQLFFTVGRNLDDWIPSWNTEDVFFITVFTIAVITPLIRHPFWMKYGATVLNTLGVVITALISLLGLAPKSVLLYFVVWASFGYIAERREYYPSRVLPFFMILTMAFMTFDLWSMGNTGGTVGVEMVTISSILVAGINMYLLKLDYNENDNFFAETNKILEDMGELSRRMVNILSRSMEVDHLMTAISKECAELMYLEDISIYLYDSDSEQLVLSGTNDSNTTRIHSDLGIINKVFTTGKTHNIPELRYSKDATVESIYESELAVPIIIEEEVLGVIDTRNSMKGFYMERHELLLSVIASFCAIKIKESIAKESLLKARKAEEEMAYYRELNKLKEQFITNISHDLKTPISLIKGPAQLLMQTDDVAESKRLSKYILKNSEHLFGMISQLLELNHLDRGINKVRLEMVDTKKLMKSICDQYEGDLIQRKIRFETILESPSIYSDRFRVEQIVHNLLQNAFKHTPDEGKVLLKVTANENNELCILVKDNGPGIPMDLHDQVFERFFKVDENNHEGTGIGLSLVKEYVSDLNGSVQLESSPGNGAAFSIFLPIQEETAVLQPSVDLPETKQEALSSESKPIMFVIEDNVELNEFICSFFEGEYCCVSALNGEEAMELMNQQVPDIILTDLMMPKKDGESLVKEIKEREEWNHIPIIVLTAKSNINERIALYEMGIDNYIEKPFEVFELKAIVDKTLNLHRALRDKLHQHLLRENAHSENTSTIEDQHQDSLLNQLYTLVLENLHNKDLNVPFLNAKLGTGRNALQREVKSLTGLTPSEFIRSIRLGEAKKLLESKQYNVSEVAYQVGFNTLSYFSRSFKLEFGILPSEFMENLPVE